MHDRFSIRSRPHFSYASLLPFAVLCLALHCPIAWADTAESPLSAPYSYQIDIEEGRLTLKASGTPLDVLLKAIAEKAGFTMTLRGDLSTPISLSFSGLRVEQAIRRLTGDLGLVMIFDRDRDSDAPKRLIEVRVYANIKRANRPPSEQGALAVAEDLDQASDEAENAGEEDAIAIQARKLLTAENAADKKQAIKALTALGGIQAVAALTEGLEDEDRSIRGEIVRALGAIGEESATQTLGQVLIADTEPALRLEAVTAIAKHPGPVARVFLEAALKDSDESVRQAAKAALQQ